MKKIIGETELEALVRNGVLNVGREMILTPQARETAARKGYRLKYDQDTHKSSAPIGDDDLGKLIEQVLTRELAGKLHARPAEAPLPEPAQPAAAPAPVQPSVFDQPERPAGSRAVVAATGLNRPGIVARITSLIADMGGDLMGVNQVIVDGWFSLIFVVDLEASRDQMSFRVFKEQLKDLSSQLGSMEITVMNEEIFQAMHRV